VRACGLAVAVLLAGASAGCADLLPKASSEVSSPWASFDDARAAIERIVPEKTSVPELQMQGIDPYISPNVQLLSYSDILLRFPINGPSARERLDPGLAACLDAGKACTGYAITARDTRRDHVGGFWQDVLGFKRVVEVTGWSFNALILLVGDRVVYTLYGGQPLVHEHEVTRQPLGPLQGIGESLPVGNLVR
jgi:hypothetical protein